MMLIEIEELLKKKMGLDAASIGQQNVARVIRAQMEAHLITDDDTYLSLLRSSGTAFQDLIDAVIVPETWFFRDVEAFRALGNIVSGEWAMRHPGEALRLLSLPCSTGEEPYSMAMALLEAGVPSQRFCIDALDISQQSLKKCKNAIYTKNSFRGNNIEFRDRYFTSVEGGHRPVDQVREAVAFNQANLFGLDLLKNANCYDVIFCRNLLIYFGRSEQIKAVEILGRLLSQDGILFVGPAEAGILLECGFESTKISLSFAFRKSTGSRMPSPANQPEYARPNPVDLQPAIVPRPAPRQEVMEAVSAPELSLVVPVPVERSIEEIEGMADAGRLDEATRECQSYIRNRGPSAPAFYLMALLSDADGNMPEAARYYQKALYLEPNHLRAMRHLALIFGKQGNISAARAMSERLRRAEKKGERV